MSQLFKYPRTLHVPNSPGTNSDDRLASYEDLSILYNKEIVVTEKLDGENTSLYRDYMHVRSLDSRPHPSQNWVRQLHASIQHEIPDNWRICAENLYAKHSIYYDKLPTFLFVFSIWNEKNEALSWNETKTYCDMLGLHTVPVLYQGKWDEEKIKTCYTGKSLYADEQEGYVVRSEEGFPYPVVSETKHEMPFFKQLFKYVRAKHVQTDDHWRMTWTPNKLMQS